MTEIDQDLAARLREARAASGLSQGRIAKLVGVTAAQVSRIENGKRGVSTGVMYQWFKACGFDVEAVEIGEESVAVELVELVEAMSPDDLALALQVLRVIPQLRGRARSALAAMVAPPEP